MGTTFLTPERLRTLERAFPRARIAVLGDYFLDKYLEVRPDLEEVSVETGKPAHQVTQTRCSPGAAGTVVSNLVALGVGEIHAVGFVGDDGEGYDLRKGLKRLGCHQEHLHVLAERSTPTYLKPRDGTGSTLEAEHPRYDTKNYHPVPSEVEKLILGSLESLLPDIDAVIVLDQVEVRNTGVVTDNVRKHISTWAQQWSDVIFWADSRHRIREFQNVILKPNQFEVVDQRHPQPGATIEQDLLQSRARELRQKNGAPIVVTLGERGVMVSDPEWTRVPALRVEGPIDPTGAGDSATAGAVLALSAGATLIEAALTGNLVASLTIQQMGTTGTARPEQLASQLELWHHQQERD